MPSSPSAVRRSSVATLLTGVLVVAVYFVLRGLEIGKIGAETDIGGGMLLLMGYVLTALGAVLVGRDLLHHRSRGH